MTSRARFKRRAAAAATSTSVAYGKGIEGAAAIAEATANVPRKNAMAVSPKSSKRLFEVLVASTADKTRVVGEFLKGVPDRLAAVAKKHAMNGLIRHFGFLDEAAFVEHLRTKVAAMEARDRTATEFREGALGRQNAFIGGLFELCVKYGPIRKYILSLATGAMETINEDISAASRRGATYVMHDASGNRVQVADRFSKPLAANAFDIDTREGVKESLDFGSISFNGQGHWCIPLPVEIKLPRAAGAVAGQFVEFPERIAAAAKAKRKVFAYFDVADQKVVERYVGTTAVIGIETIDGRAMVKVALDPSKLVFNTEEVYGTMSRNQLLVRPDANVWNPAQPTAAPPLRPEPVFSIGKVGGQPVSIGVAASAKGDGFNYWRMLVPAKRELFVDLYAAIFDVEP